LDQQTDVNSAFSIGGSIGSPFGTKTSQGLITQFTYTVIPEPSAVSLLLIGGLIFVTKRKNLK
jgi:hypothetical protein